MNRLPFTVTRPDGTTDARLGRLTTPHGIVETPQFMPVATAGCVRAQRTESLAPAGASMLLANTWHLARSPGVERVATLGGLHRCMGWGGPILTDSGGFQGYSLGQHARVDEGGIELTEPSSRSRMRLSPESSVSAQLTLGADIAMVLDHCVASTVPEAAARDAMERTHRWALRGLGARGDAPTGLFAIVQGASHASLRRESTLRLTGEAFDGFAIGGLAVGEPREERETVTAQVAALLPADRPRYLMGVGTPLDLLEAVHRGIDLFDCILPTAMAQRGRAYTSLGRVELRRGVYADQDRPLDPRCSCQTCLTTSRAWLRHLYAAREPLAWTLIGLHNLHFWLGLMARIRAALSTGGFSALYTDARSKLDASDLEHPVSSPRPRTPPVAPPAALGRWRLHRNPGFEGGPAFTSIQDRTSGEIMHAVSAPPDEAHRLYVEQPLVRERARAGGEALVVWDVGLGAATNAMEVIRAWEEAEATRPLHLVSFERDLDALRLALLHPHAFPRLRHGAPAALLAQGCWRSKRAAITWELRVGDALEALPQVPAPDLILWDPFSFKVDAPLWSLAAFRTVRAACRDKSTALYTYSNSTAVRVALLLAGFYVAPGVASGPKQQTTIALCEPDGRPLLGPAFLERWRRSAARWPTDVAPDQHASLEAALLAHPQWRLDQSGALLA
ncbi:MAG: tRNA guanosine(34) transglycosylase Tgt [Myxococcales bacterium]|nr:tRNA guanosine(34) transglycosylase Tgt [Myxococcales bacterium]